MNLLDFLKTVNVYCEKNSDTSKITSIRAGGKAKYILYPKSIDDLIVIIKSLKMLRQKYKIIGGCTNTFFSDMGYDGVIVSTKCIKGKNVSGDSISVCCGESLASLLQYCAANGYNIAAELFGIPGTLGGAVRNNAGAFGKDISDSFISGEFFDCDSYNIFTLSKREMQFSYRSSILQKENLVFLHGNFKIEPLAVDIIKNNFRDVVNKRIASQPTEPSLGSFFKRSNEIIPSKMIDLAGLKGTRVGDAEISKKHAGFIVNRGCASANDINELAILVEKTIFEKYGIRLLREAEYVV